MSKDITGGNQVELVMNRKLADGFTKSDAAHDLKVILSNWLVGIRDELEQGIVLIPNGEGGLKQDMFTDRDTNEYRGRADMLRKVIGLISETLPDEYEETEDGS